MPCGQQLAGGVALPFRGFIPQLRQSFQSMQPPTHANALHGFPSTRSSRASSRIVKTVTQSFELHRRQVVETRMGSDLVFAAAAECRLTTRRRQRVRTEAARDFSTSSVSSVAGTDNLLLERTSTNALKVGSGGQGRTNSPGANLDMRSMPAGRRPWMARVNQPPTRGSSLRRKPRFGATKPKTGKGILFGRPNRPTRPSVSRTGSLNTGPNFGVPQRGQRLTGITTELLPNRTPNGPQRPGGNLRRTAGGSIPA